MPIAADSLRLGPWRDGVNYSAPAEDEIMEDAKSWDALFAGIGD